MFFVVTLKYSTYFTKLGLDNPDWEYTRVDLFMRLTNLWVAIRGVMGEEMNMRIVGIDKEKESISFYVNQQGEECLVFVAKDMGIDIVVESEEEFF